MDMTDQGWEFKKRAVIELSTGSTQSGLIAERTEEELSTFIGFIAATDQPVVVLEQGSERELAFFNWSHVVSVRFV